MNALASPDVSDFEETCKIVVSRYFAPGMDRDDLLQEARIGVWEGLRDWRPDGGRTLETFVSFTAERKVLTAVRTATRKKHQPLSGSLRALVDEDGEETDVYATSVAPDRWEPEVAVELREEMRELADALRERLTDLECACLVGLLNDETYEQIAMRYGVSTKMVDNALWRAREKLNGNSTGQRRGVHGYTCPSCGCATVKRRAGRGRPPRCVVCRVRRGEIAA